MPEYRICSVLHVPVKRGEWAEYSPVSGAGASASSVGERAAYFAAGADQLNEVALLQISIHHGNKGQWVVFGKVER